MRKHGIGTRRDGRLASDVSLGGTVGCTNGEPLVIKDRQKEMGSIEHDDQHISNGARVIRSDAVILYEQIASVDNLSLGEKTFM
jgi:hypothetical protein